MSNYSQKIIFKLDKYAIDYLEDVIIEELENE